MKITSTLQMIVAACVVLSGASASADIQLFPGQSIYIDGTTVSCGFGNPIQVASVASQCVPVDPNYGALKNDLKLIVSLTNGQVHLGEVGTYQYQSDCAAAQVSAPTCGGFGCTRMMCVPVDSDYGALQNTLENVSIGSDGTISITAIGTYQYRTDCQAAAH